MRSGQRALAAACLLTLLGAGCTPSDPPAPPATTTPSPTPTENAQEREERLAYASAEKSYREFRAEVERVYAQGGATRPTKVMTETAGGPYLKSYQEVSSAYHGLGHHSEGKLVIEYLRPAGYSPTEVALDTCENGLAVVTYDSKGKRLYADDIRKISLVVRLVGQQWKVWSGKGTKESSCD